MRTSSKPLVATVALALLTGCGSGSEKPTSPDAAATAQAVAADADAEPNVPVAADENPFGPAGTVFATLDAVTTSHAGAGHLVGRPNGGDGDSGIYAIDGSPLDPEFVGLVPSSSTGGWGWGDARLTEFGVILSARRQADGLVAGEDVFASVDPSSGEVFWTRSRTDGWLEDTATGLLVVRDDGVAGVDPETGEETWSKAADVVGHEEENYTRMHAVREALGGKCVDATTGELSAPQLVPHPDKSEGAPLVDECGPVVRRVGDAMSGFADGKVVWTVPGRGTVRDERYGLVVVEGSDTDVVLVLEAHSGETVATLPTDSLSALAGCSYPELLSRKVLTLECSDGDGPSKLVSLG